MHAALTVAAFAVGAFAVPFKRDVVYDYDVVYVTDVVTVTAGQPAAYQAAPSSAVEHVHHAHHGHGPHHWHPSSSSVEAVTTISTSSYEAPLPTWTPEPDTSTTPTTPAYTPPPTTSSSEPAYTPPAPTSTPEPVFSFPAPTSTPEPVFSVPAPTSTPEPVFSAPAPSPSSEAPTSSSAPAKPTGYQDIVLYHHNAHRANHSASDLTWDDDLASWAEELASGCIFEHNTDIGGGGYGQNLAAGDSPDNAGNFVSNMWYNSEMANYEGLYGQASPSMTDFGSWGHFSQIVWKGSQKVGCATVSCPNGLFSSDHGKLSPMDGVTGFNTVCNYSPTGNMLGEFNDNVGEPMGAPSISEDAPGY